MSKSKVELSIYESIDEIRIFISEERYPDAIQRAIEIKREYNIKEEYSEYYCTICKLLALCYRRSNMPDEAIYILSDAIKFSKKKYLQSDSAKYYREYAVLLVNLGIVYDARGDKIQALEEYKNAEEVFKHIQDNNSLFKLFLTMCNTYYDTGNLDKAAEVLDQAVELAKSCKLMYDEKVINKYKKMIREEKINVNR